MAVYTSVSAEEISEFLSQYSLGSLVGFSEIGDGIENSNFFVTLNASHQQALDNTEWVLTLFENLTEQQLPFFLEIMCWLVTKNFPVPAPSPLNSGELYSLLKGKPAILVPRFKGRSIDSPDAGHCEQVGRFLAQMHLGLADCPQQRVAPRDLAWMRVREENLSSVLSPDELSLVSGSINHYQEMKHRIEECPTGIIHGDLFKDNVLFDGTNISGVIDFFHACNDSLLFDLAVIANDWATHDDGSYSESRLASLVSGYRSVREWSESECSLWSEFLHLAALKFWLSRLESRYLPGYQQDSTNGDQTKDPDELKRIILKLTPSLHS